MKEYNKKNKKEISENQKIYNNNHKEEIKKQKKEWYDDNKVEMSEKYQKNKIEISEKRKEKIECECGCVICKNYLLIHQKTTRHLDLMLLQI